MSGGSTTRGPSAWGGGGTGGGSGGAPVDGPYVTTATDGTLNNETLIGAIILPADTFANRPSAAGLVAGTLYTSNDTGVTYRANGSGTWVEHVVALYRGTSTQIKSNDDIIARATGGGVTLGAQGPSSKASLAFGLLSDTVLYRDAADTFRTADAFIHDGRTTLAAADAKTQTVGATGSTETLDALVYGAFDMTMDQACTFTFSNPGPSGTLSVFVLILRGAFTPTWPASVDWSSATPPTYTTPSVYTFSTVDAGTTWLGAQVGRAFA